MLNTREIDMFFKFTTSLLVTFLLCSLTLGQEIDWLTDMEAAKQKAADENKLILIHFTADWCGGCQQLEQFVFNNISLIGAIESQVIPVKIDVDLHPDLVEKYNVKGIPFDVTTNANGDVVTQRRSPASRDDYMSMISQISKMNPNQFASADPVQREFLEQYRANNQPSSQGPGLDFNSNQLSFRPSGSSIDPMLESDSPSVGAEPAGFRPADFRQTASSVQQPTDFRVDGPTIPEMPPAPAANDQFVGTPGFTQNNMLEEQPAPPTATQDQFQIPAPTTETVQNRSQSQRIINPMFVKQKPVQEPIQEQAANPVAQFDSQPMHQEPEQVAPPEFALGGNCPVTLLTDSRWVKGDKQFGCVHRGRVYIFASAANMKTFLTSPDDYSPILAGFDPVDFCDLGELNEGEASLGVFMSKSGQQKVVLFRSSDNRAKFQSEPKKYLEAVRTATQRLDQQIVR